MLLGVSGWRYYCDLTYNNAPGRGCIWLRKRKPAPVETNEQIIARLAPDYEECTRDEADRASYALGVERTGVLLTSKGWRFRHDLIGNCGPASDYVWLRKRKPAPVERWKSATRDDALKALENGERVEVSGGGFAAWWEMRWDATGPQYQEADTGEWVGDRGGAMYRIIDTPPVLVERWNSASRGDALKALGSGERVEVLACGRMATMRWTERGPQWLDSKSIWSDDDDGNEVNYRILDTRPRRTFFGRWIEVDTFAEAEPAGVFEVDGFPVAFVFNGHGIGSMASGAIPKRWSWVARIPGK